MVPIYGPCIPTVVSENIYAPSSVRENNTTSTAKIIPIRRLLAVVSTIRRGSFTGHSHHPRDVSKLQTHLHKETAIANVMQSYAGLVLELKVSLPRIKKTSPSDGINTIPVQGFGVLATQCAGAGIKPTRNTLKQMAQEV